MQVICQIKADMVAQELFSFEDVAAELDVIPELPRLFHEAHVTQEAESMPSSRLSLGYAERALEAPSVSEQVFVTFFVKAGKRAKCCAYGMTPWVAAPKKLLYQTASSPSSTGRLRSSGAERK